MQNDGANKNILSADGRKAEFLTFNKLKELAANQCWMEYDLYEEDKFTIRFADAIGIQAPSSQKSKSMHIYNVHVQRLDKYQQGVNIVDNQKILHD